MENGEYSCPLFSPQISVLASHKVSLIYSSPRKFSGERSVINQAPGWLERMKWQPLLAARSAAKFFGYNESVPKFLFTDHISTVPYFSQTEYWFFSMSLILPKIWVLSLIDCPLKKNACTCKQKQIRTCLFTYLELVSMIQVFVCKAGMVVLLSRQLLPP